MKKTLLSTFCLAVALSLSATDYYAQQRASWLQKAKASESTLVETICRPQCLVRSVPDTNAFQGWRMEQVAPMSALYDVSFKQQQTAIVDFGRHMVGYYTFRLQTTARTQDAPLRLRFTFAEVPAELNTPFDPYPGTLSRAWLQDEVVTLMEIDRDLTLTRRFACRYVKIELLGSSPDFDFRFADMSFKAVSSAPDLNIPLRSTTPQPIADIWEVGLETLRECMQTVYEDGPKRDMRLWIGDLYLESLANAETFRNHQLTRHCLYMLAALAAEDGRLHANVFERPDYHPQLGSHCLDYSLLYNVALLEYLKATGDTDTAEDLWNVAKFQMEDALGYVTPDGIFDRNRKGEWIWLFFDWCAPLNHDTPMQALMVFALNNSYDLATRLGKQDEVRHWRTMAKKMTKAARKQLWDKKQGVFVSGADKQVSYLSQVWMILSGIVSPAEGATLMRNVLAIDDAVYQGTPYATHYLIEALIKCGMHQQAKDYLINYWGDMVNKGADTFWEVYDPNDEYKSPYNFYPVNSYCHAWSCTPIYFIQKYPDIFQQ